MYGIYTPILIFQAFCIYQAYRNNAGNRWYWIIVLLPVVGCILYLVHKSNTKTSLQSTMPGNVREAAVSNRMLEKLEESFAYNDSFKNKESLADAYAELGRYPEAITLYSSCLEGFMSDDPAVRMKLLNAHFLNGDHDAAVGYGKDLEGEKLFKNSEERVGYAWSLLQTGDADHAEKIFADMDRSFTNYYHRYEYCKFLLKRKKTESAKEKLTNLLDEFDKMQITERLLQKNIFSSVRDLYANHFRAV